MKNKTLEQAVRHLYEARLSAKEAQGSFSLTAYEVGPCHADEEKELRCYINRNLALDDWCDACKAKNPLWEDYHKKSNIAGAALRSVMLIGKSLPKN